VLNQIASLIRRADRKADGYSRDLQAARLRASYQRAYFAPALFNLVPVKTDLIATMAVDAYWRLYYNESWMATHTVDENAALLIHEVGHLLRDHERERSQPAPGMRGCGIPRPTARSTTISRRRGCRCPAIRPSRGHTVFPPARPSELYYKALSTPKAPSKDDPRPFDGQSRPSEVEGRQTQGRPERSRGTSAIADRVRMANGGHGSCRPTKRVRVAHQVLMR
jgi:hypothetical protein